MEKEIEMALFQGRGHELLRFREIQAFLDRERALVPYLDQAGAILPLRDPAREILIGQGMVLDLDGQALVAGIH